MKELNFKKRLALTKILVSISIAGSLASLYTMNKGYGELYPLYPYKLFTQPTGSQHSYTEYRIYAKKRHNDDFRRIEIRPTKTFIEEQYIGSLNYFVKKTIEDSLCKTEYKNRLYIFVKHMVPEQTEYKIVSETYDPINLLNKNIPYDTATVVTF